MSNPDIGLVVECRDSFTLRLFCGPGRVGLWYACGERIELLEPVPEVVRGPREGFWRVRVVSDGREGWMFVATAAIERACAAR